jgi:hypothetical protein
MWALAQSLNVIAAALSSLAACPGSAALRSGPSRCLARRRVGNIPRRRLFLLGSLLNPGRKIMNGVIYLIGLIVVILAILSFFGLR